MAKNSYIDIKYNYRTILYKKYHNIIINSTIIVFWILLWYYF